MALAHSTLGRSLHFMGDHSGARAELEFSVQYQSRSRLPGETYLGLDRNTLDSLGLARTLWLQGHPSQSAECARQTVKDAKSRNHPASLVVALSWAPGIFLWIGDLRSAEEHADWLISHAESHSLGPYLAVGRGYKGALAVRKGDARGGVESLQACLEQLRTMRYEMRYTEFKLSLVQGLVGIGQFAEGMTLVDESIRLVEASGELLYMPEALRVKGSVLLSIPQRRAHDAQMCFIQSLAWSRRQDARSWELRTAVDLAALWAAQGQPESARALLSPILEQFVEGLDTADLMAAGTPAGHFAVVDGTLAASTVLVAGRAPLWALCPSKHTRRPQPRFMFYGRQARMAAGIVRHTGFDRHLWFGLGLARPGPPAGPARPRPTAPPHRSPQHPPAASCSLPRSRINCSCSSSSVV